MLYILTSVSLAVPMQSSMEILTSPSSTMILNSKRGPFGLYLYFLSINNTYVVTSLFSILFAFLITSPPVKLFNFIIGFFMILLFIFGLASLGLGICIKYFFF